MILLNTAAIKVYAVLSGIVCQENFQEIIIMGIEYVINENSFEIEGLKVDVDFSSATDLGSAMDRKKRYGAICTAIRMASGMKRPEYAKSLGIPYRTYQDWELGNSQVPEYVLRLMAYKVHMENLLKKGALVYADEEENN